MMVNINEQVIDQEPTWENIEAFLSERLGDTLSEVDKCVTRIYWEAGSEEWSDKALKEVIAHLEKELKAEGCSCCYNSIETI